MILLVGLNTPAACTHALLLCLLPYGAAAQVDFLTGAPQEQQQPQVQADGSTAAADGSSEESSGNLVRTATAVVDGQAKQFKVEYLMNYPTKGGYMMDVKLSFDYMDTQHRCGSSSMIQGQGLSVRDCGLGFQVCWWVDWAGWGQARMVRTVHGRGCCRGKVCVPGISSLPAASLSSVKTAISCCHQQQMRMLFCMMPWQPHMWCFFGALWSTSAKIVNEYHPSAAACCSG